MQCSVINPGLFRPIGKAHGAPGMSNHASGPLVPILLGLIRPSAIIGFVVTIVVNPIKRLSIRPFAHVRKEVFKVAPSGAHHDAAPAVALERLIAGTVTATHHARPESVAGSAGHAMGGAFTPTAFCIAALQILSGNDASLSAVAKAFAFVIRKFRNAGEVVESDSNQSLPMPLPPCLAKLGSRASAANGFSEIVDANHDSLAAIAVTKPEVNAVGFPGVFASYKPAKSLAGSVNKQVMRWHGSHARILRKNKAPAMGQRETQEQEGPPAAEQAA